MTLDAFRNYCLQFNHVTEDFPFGPDVLAFRVHNKIFALVPIDVKPLQANLRMDPDLVEEWRANYTAVQPGYHMNKKLWNTVVLGTTDIPKTEKLWLIKHSYEQIWNGLPKKLREA
jgi:predicted DNA-binding protein (MmcQ/YjbR family)